MAIADTLSISAGGAITSTTFTPGSSVRYSTLDLHAFLQDLADNPTAAGDDLVSILGSNPSELAGKRNASRPMALTLLPTIAIDDATAKWFKFGSIEQGAGQTLYTGLKVLGTLVADSPIYITQSGSKLTKYWADADVNTAFQILVKAKNAGTLIDSGNITVYSRKFGQTYSHFDVNLAAGGEQAAALGTSIDNNVALSAAAAETIFGTITLTVGDTTQNLGGGQGSLLHKGTIALNGTTTLAQAYQALMWACSESSTATLAGASGWKYRKLNALYAENVAAPFGSFAGGKWFVAQGWWLSGVMAADSKNYQLTSHTGIVETPPTSVAVQVGGVVSGDYVLVARDNGSGGILTSEYTVSGSSGATTLSVPTLKADTPLSGFVRIDGDRYTYSSWTGTTLSGLSPALTKTYTSRPAFIPLIDAVASATTINSANFQFSSAFTCRYRVRNGAGGSAIVPFESTLSVTETGGSGTAVRGSDE